MNGQRKYWLVAGLILSFVGGCSGDNSTDPAGGTGGAGGSGGSGGSGGANPDGGLWDFTPPVDPGKGGVLITASGETIAMSGYPFPPANADDPQLYDGWNLEFDRILATFDHIALSATPDKDSGDQSKTDGVVARVDGPWAVDLHHDGPGNIDGKSSGERAVPIAALSRQSNGNAFSTDGTRYAFGFDTIAATKSAINVNLDADALADYGDMVQNGCAVMYVGTATFKGSAACNMGRENWPTTVKFRLCFKTPTTYVNCQNPDNMGEPFPNEESQRGIAFDPNASVIAQVTFHPDHPFWDSVLHDSPTHFDQFAARAVGADSGTPTVTLEDTKGVDYTAYTDSLGNALQWRYCAEPPTDTHPKFTGPMAFDRRRVPHATDGDPKTGLRDYYDFATYNQSTQGHLNADGLCFVKRNYDSPR
ncbi:MAG: hypothetical protein ABW133_17865 [Polyangiaceae bacterium]